MKHAGSWQRKRWWGIPASWQPGWPVALLAPIPLRQLGRKPWLALRRDPAQPHGWSATWDAGPRGRAGRGQPNPTPAEPSTERVVVDAAASSSHLCLTPKGELCCHVCRDGVSMGWAQERASPMWVLEPFCWQGG